MTSKALAVAKWEYFEKLKSKAFLISLFLMPLVWAVFGFLPMIFANQEDKETRIIGIIDGTGDVIKPFADKMESRYKLSNGQPNYLIQNIASGKDLDITRAITEGNGKVLSGEIEGYLIVNQRGRPDSVAEYRARNVGDFNVTNRIEENLKSVLSEKKLIAHGLKPKLLEELAVPLTLKTVKLSKSGETEESGFAKVYFSAYVFLMMLVFLIMTSGQMLIRSVIEEKANRIVEVLVSSCSPTDLMAGKVLGLSAIGLTQIGFWAVVGVAASMQFGLNVVPSGQALLLVVYFVLGYLLYAAIFIAAGSPLTREQEAQQISGYLVLILFIPMIIALPAIQNPNATWLKVLTYFPLLTPTMMALRIPIQTPPVAEIVATILLLLVSIYVAMWVAGRIFRIAILTTGKRPGLGEMIRWVKTG